MGREANSITLYNADLKSKYVLLHVYKLEGKRGDSGILCGSEADVRVLGVAAAIPKGRCTCQHTRQRANDAFFSFHDKNGKRKR